MDAERQCLGERSDQVSAAVVLHLYDRIPASTGVAADGEHRYSRVDARGYDERLVGGYGQFLRARVAPPGLWRAAAAAFQGQDEIEHACSVAGGGDTTGAKWNGMCDRRKRSNSGLRLQTNRKRKQASKYHHEAQGDHPRSTAEDGRPSPTGRSE